MLYNVVASVTQPVLCANKQITTQPCTQHIYNKTDLILTKQCSIMRSNEEKKHCLDGDAGERLF